MEKKGKRNPNKRKKTENEYVADAIERETDEQITQNLLEGQIRHQTQIWIYRRGTKFNEPCPGIYIYARETSPHKWIPIYIGQTENVNVRLTNHEQRECVDQNGATHIHVSIITNEKSRLAIEKDLIQQWTPVCNAQFGLIAEEVAEANPDLVVRDETGEIYTVRYDAVTAMLLNEFLKEHRKIEEQERIIQEQEATITEVKSNAARQEATIALQQQEIQALTATVKEQIAQIQKVNVRFEMRNPHRTWSTTISEAADNLSKAGWSWSCVSTVDSNGQTIFVADAHRDNGNRFVVHADEKLTAFVFSDSQITQCKLPHSHNRREKRNGSLGPRSRTAATSLA